MECQPVDCLRPKYDFGGCRFQHCRARARLPTRCGSDPGPKPLRSDNPSWVAPGTNVRARWETRWQYRPAPIRPAPNRWTPTQLRPNRQVRASPGRPFVAVRPRWPFAVKFASTTLRDSCVVLRHAKSCCDRFVKPRCPAPNLAGGFVAYATSAPPPVSPRAHRRSRSAVEAGPCVASRSAHGKGR